MYSVIVFMSHVPPFTRKKKSGINTRFEFLELNLVSHLTRPHSESFYSEDWPGVGGSAVSTVRMVGFLEQLCSKPTREKICMVVREWCKLIPNVFEISMILAISMVFTIFSKQVQDKLHQIVSPPETHSDLRTRPVSVCLLL